MKHVTASYSPRRGGSAAHTFRLGVSADEVEAFVLRRFRAREESTVYIAGDVAGGVEKLDGRWTWWLDYAGVQEASKSTQTLP